MCGPFDSISHFLKKMIIVLQDERSAKLDIFDILEKMYLERVLRKPEVQVQYSFSSALPPTNKSYHKLQNVPDVPRRFIKLEICFWPQDTPDGSAF